MANTEFLQIVALCVRACRYISNLCRQLLGSAKIGDALPDLGDRLLRARLVVALVLLLPPVVTALHEYVAT